LFVCLYFFVIRINRIAYTDELLYN